MIRTREELEQLEKRILAPYAVRSAESRGREFKEAEDPYRTCFQRDVDRITHCMAHRRLSKKTQVFFAGHGDHFHNRSSHTSEVVRLARTVSRTLGLNEDLTEAIALAHDLGHPCFGHKGESVLDNLLQPSDGHFEHNEQSLWIVERLERKNSQYPGLNLSFEVRDGLNKHRSPYDRPKSKNLKMPSLEAQIVNIADEIAYKHHDIDDALRAKIISFRDLEGLGIWKRAREKHSGKPNVIKLMANDLVKNTEESLKVLKIKSADDVCDQKEPLARFSEAMSVNIRELGAFLEEKFYRSPAVTRYNDQGERVIRFLFKSFYDKPELMPHDFTLRLENEEKTVVVKDYIAGMTDHYAIELYEEMSGKTFLS